MVQSLKANLKEIYFQVPRLNFPRTYGLGFVEYLIQSLRELLSCKPDSVLYVAYQIDAIRRDLESLTSSLGDNMQQGSIEIQRQHHLFIRLNDVAYLAEYVIDSIMIGNTGEWHHLLWLYHASEEIRYDEGSNFDLIAQPAENGTNSPVIIMDG
ncbi:hypothetical protein ACH5RR_040519 [Cinchona calisaya]|uniref:Uncharacterized protein n=1 Tax=Cinchona calisaya TaxID=153742 RepID=A0ABD2XRX8_9GENT